MMQINDNFIGTKQSITYKTKYFQAWVDNLLRFAETSEAKRKKVAAFLFKEGNMVSHAINGTPPGWYTNDCEIVVNGEIVTSPYVKHAERQCLDKMLVRNESTQGCELLVSLSPCLHCAIDLVAAGIKAVYYVEEYRCREGIEYLEKSNVCVCCVDKVLCELSFREKHKKVQP